MRGDRAKCRANAGACLPATRHKLQRRPGIRRFRFDVRAAHRTSLNPEPSYRDWRAATMRLLQKSTWRPRRAPDHGRIRLFALRQKPLSVPPAGSFRRELVGGVSDRSIQHSTRMGLSFERGPTRRPRLWRTGASQGGKLTMRIDTVDRLHPPCLPATRHSLLRRP
jgi:hypothetical protein